MPRGLGDFAEVGGGGGRGRGAFSFWCSGDFSRPLFGAFDVGD